jgi:transcriptional regulator GlxA family with amidase domain
MAQDLRIAEAIAAQMAHLRSAASAEHLGELAGLSPRQLQRVLADFCKRYRMNASSWRDMRNRYRLQLAIFLLSVPSLSVATIADEVGYASSAALIRALAKAGLPPASELRAELARLGSSAL